MDTKPESHSFGEGAFTQHLTWGLVIYNSLMAFTGGKTLEIMFISCYNSE